MNIFLPFILLMAFASKLTAQRKIFQHIYGTQMRLETFTKLARTSDAGYLAVGTSETPGGEADVLVARLDSTGTVLWSNILTSNNSDAGEQIAEIQSGNIFVAANTSVSGNQDMVLTKLNKVGTELWSVSYGGSDYEELRAMAHSPMGKLYVAGNTLSVGTALLKNAIIMQIDTASGTVTKSVVMSNYASQDLLGLVSTPDGGVVASGYCGQNQAHLDPLVIRLDKNMQVLWAKRFALPSLQILYNINLAADSGYVAVGNGYDATNGSNIIVLKMSPQGLLQWAKAVNIGMYSRGFEVLTNFNDKSYTISGYTSAGKQRAVLIKLDAQGNPLWGKAYSDTMNFSDYINKGAVLGNNQGVSFTGTHFIPTDANGAAVLVRTDYHGNAAGCNTDILTVTTSHLAFTDTALFGLVGNLLLNEQSLSWVMNNAFLNKGVLCATNDTTNYVDTLRQPTSPNSINEVRSASTKLWPNPATRNITISIAIPTKFLPARVSVTDILGNEVLSATPDNEITLPVSELSSGIYFVRAGNEVIKFAKE